MRKIRKEQLCEMIDTLKDAHKEILGQSAEAICNVLADCQECAVAIGNMIEESEGDGQVTVSLLVQYCEMLYRISVAVGEGQEWKVLNGETKSLLGQIQGSIRQDIRDSYEIVFLPYKASMWDSMESIWLAAREDKRCNCHVIPIPYFEKDKDGKVNEMSYEGDKFPREVPITDYQSYSLQENHPDVIYFHTPFDQYNYVTSVHPAYYSYELKKHTDMLVYVPYFITVGGMPDAQMGASAYRYADRIILQNKEMLEDMAKEIPKEKLVVLGSPKIDRMIKLEKNKPPMPEEWERFIKGRKVIFYNTSISDLLKNSEKELAKIEDVFKTFQEHQEVALIWRPHPLMRPTLQSMRHELLDQYDKLERWFVKEKIGILDKTPDVNATIALSDAYIGDGGSSVVHLFGVTGKPVFVLSQEVYPHVTMEERASVAIWRWANEGDDIWFIADGYHAICKLNLKSGAIEIVSTIPETGWDYPSQYVGLFKYKNKIVTRTAKADMLCEYDLITGMFRKFYFKDQERAEKNTLSGGVQYKQYIYFVPQGFEAIVCYDVETTEFTYYDEWIVDMRRATKTPEEGKNLFGWGSAIYQNQIVLPSETSNKVLLFDMDTAEYSIREVGAESNVYVKIICGKQYFWLMTSGYAVVRWDIETNQTENYDKFPDGYEANEFPYAHCEEIQGSLLGLGKRKKTSLKYNNDEKTTEKMLDLLPYEEGEYLSAYYKKPEIYRYIRLINESKIGGFTTYDDSFFTLHLLNGAYHKYPLRLQHDYVKENICKHLKSKFSKCGTFPYICFENKSITLDMFIIYEESTWHNKGEQIKNYMEIAENMDGTSGQRIHGYIMGQIN